MSAVKRAVANLKKPHDPPHRAALMRDLWETVLYEIKDIHEDDSDAWFSRMKKLNGTLKPAYDVLVWRVLWEIFCAFDRGSNAEANSDIPPCPSGAEGA